jgi:hypothetical protein
VNAGTAPKLGIIGRERSLVNGLAKKLRRDCSRNHEHTDIKETDRGASFDLHLFEGNEPTNRIVRVTVEMIGVKNDGGKPE